ncbi:MAG: DUF805 domain-containing protein [Paracoccaceae bacterium]
MEFKEAVSACLGKYATISGRARRSEFWWWVLFTFLVTAVASVLDAILGFAGPSGGPVGGLLALALLLPNICVGVRRLHDTDRSAWWLLIILVPLIGFLILIYFFTQRGTVGDNRFGPDPVLAQPRSGAE